MRRITGAFATVLFMGGCGGDTVGVGDASFMVAAMAGGPYEEYSGSGTFEIRPATTPGPLFTLASAGRGTSANQRFTFHTAATPGAGDYAIGSPAPGHVLAAYWVQDGDAVRLFTAESGSLRITESTAVRSGGRLAGRVAGSFEASFRLTNVCVLLPGFPSDILSCQPASETETVSAAGSFVAGPLGGDNPGLVLGGG